MDMTKTTLAHLLKSAQSQLTDSSTPRLDACILLSFAGDKPQHWLLANSSVPVNNLFGNKAINLFRDLINQRASGVPIAYIVGRKEFYGIDLFVTQDTLIPRPESEIIVDEVIATVPSNSRLLDMGTGTGALAIAISAHRPDIEVYACDNSSPALEVAKKNIDHHQANIHTLKSDLFSSCTNQSFNTVIANLPYLPDSYTAKPDLQYEPMDALIGGKDGLDIYRRFFAQVRNVDNLTIITEHLPNQTNSMRSIAADNGFILNKSLSELCTVYTSSTK